MSPHENILQILESSHQSLKDVGFKIDLTIEIVFILLAHMN